MKMKIKLCDVKNTEYCRETGGKPYVSLSLGSDCEMFDVYSSIFADGYILVSQEDSTREYDILVNSGTTINHCHVWAIDGFLSIEESILMSIAEQYGK